MLGMCAQSIHTSKRSFMPNYIQSPQRTGLFSSLTPSDDQYVLDFTKLQDFWILILVDHFTKFLLACACKSKESTNVVQFLEKVYDTYGSPERILWDNGGEFIADIVQTLHNRHKVKVSHGMPYRPQTQGINSSSSKLISRCCRKGESDNQKKVDSCNSE